jgi:putative ABC transport system permease protein
MLLRIWAIFIVAIKRILSQFGLAVAAVLGLVIAVALTMSVPMYADGVYYRTFLETLRPSEDTIAPRPPFSFMYYYGGGLSDAVQLEDVQALNDYMTTSAGANLGLPQELMLRHFRTEIYRMFPVDATNFSDPSASLAFVRFGFVSDLEPHITIFEGNWPETPAPTSDSTIDVLIADTLATELGLQVGENYTIFVRDTTTDGIQVNTQFPIRISGVWRPTDPAETFWFFKPSFMENQLIVSEETFNSRISPYLSDEIYAAIWYFVMNGDNVDYSSVPTLIENINNVEQEVKSLLPGTRLAVSPRGDLLQYRTSANLLTILLYAFSVPIIGLLLAFVALTANLAIEQRRNEIAVLRSRGAMAGQMVGVALLEGLLLGGVALLVGLPISSMIANLIGQSRSFLSFTAQSQLRTTLTITTLAFGVGAIILALVAQVLPTIGASRYTVVTYKMERARIVRRPWWQRMWLDVLLLIPSIYGLYLLRQQGTIVEEQQILSRDPFQNPLLFLVPALMILALALLFLRLMPLIMSFIAWITSQTKSVTLLMATRHLARTPGFYSTPLVLLVLTLSLSAFTASLAETLDTHLSDQAYYEIGADVQFFDFGEDANPTSFGFGGSSAPAEEEEAVDAGPRWRFLPISDYLEMPGVLAAARVGRFGATTNLTGGAQTGEFLGVDRYELPQVAFWRKDFAPDSLATLMNLLAVDANGVLVPHSFMERYALSVGDVIRVVVSTYGQRNELDVKVVGGFDLFPTWYPDEGTLFVGNLDYLFQQAGGQFPYSIWLKADMSVNPEQFQDEGIRILQGQVVDWNSPMPEIDSEQRKPERQGLFGLLSVGFGAAAVLTVLGFLLYALFSFRRRFIEVGVLRAIGLSARQMVAFLAWELAFLILMGGLVGTGLGTLVSALFIPYLQVGTGPTANTPPFVVEVAWPAILRIYVLFGLLFVAALVALALLLRRMKIFQAIKLGETV